MGSCSEGVPQIFFKMLGRANLNNVKPPSEQEYTNKNISRGVANEF